MENSSELQQVNKGRVGQGPKKTLLSQISIESTEFIDDSTLPSSDAEGATPKHQRVDSLSMISLPDDLRLSFSGIEEESLQLDELVSCIPSSGSGTPCSNTDKGENDESDAPTMSSISSSSDKKPILNSMENDPTSMRRNKTNVGSEGAQDNSIYTWDDLMAWGTASNSQQQGSAQQVSTVGSSGEVVGKKKMISPRRSSKNKHMENVACQVCGDIAAGFYCGAFICEACKKFYMRAYKQDKLKYVCLRDKKCVITKESRVQCQYCRFQKCVGLNMYIPKQGEQGDLNKEMQMSEIPCRVCSAPSSGFHFGAITCEGCKGFFRRMAKEREPEKYQCNKKGSCEVNMVTRNLCKACRYRACVRAGMSVEGSRIGRQPNSVKHAISMELKHQGKSENGTNTASYTVIKEEPVDDDYIPSQNNTDNYSMWNLPPVTPPVTANSNTTYNGKSSSTSDLPENKLANSANPLHTTTLNNVRQRHHSAVDLMPRNSTASSSRSSTASVCVSPNVDNMYKPMSHDFTSSSSSQYSGEGQSVQYKDGVNLVVPQPNNVITPSISAQSTSSSHTSIRNQSTISPILNQSVSLTSRGFSQMLPDTECSAFDGFDKKSNESLNKVPARPAWLKAPSQSDALKPPFISEALKPPFISEALKPPFITEALKPPFITNALKPPFITEALKPPFKPDSLKSPTQPEMLKSPSQPNALKRPAGPDSLKSPADTVIPPTRLDWSEEKSVIESVLGARPFGPVFDDKMVELIRKTVDAGKCLQLLNYRVFDTDVNTSTSMNVDDIKAMFKSKFMDPRSGNQITSKVDMSIFSTRESTWNYMMTNFHHNTYITIRFAKLVPVLTQPEMLKSPSQPNALECPADLQLNQIHVLVYGWSAENTSRFKTLSLNDQVKLIQSSIYPIELLNMSKVFDPATKKYNYFTYTEEEESVMMEQFPMLRVFQEHFLHVGEMVTSFQFTDEEVAILSALLLFPAEVIGLENPKAVESLQTEISSALQFYEESTFPDGATRYGVLLVRVAELVQCLLQHNLAIGLLLTHNPTIKVPQLFHELIIESIKEGQKT